MIFFKSSSFCSYGYDEKSNKIIKVPSKLAQKIGTENEKEITNHLKNLKIINDVEMVFERPKKNWLGKNKRIDYLILNVTDACNLRCTYCAYSGHYPFERTHGKDVMSIDVAKKSIDFFLNNNNDTSDKKISIYGGEPMLAKSLTPKIVLYIREKSQKIKLSMNTNATLLTDEWIDFFIENDFELQISLDGSSLDHDRYRVDKKKQGTHEKIVSNLKKIKEKSCVFYEKNIVFIATLAPPFRLKSLFEFYNSSKLFSSQGWFINYIKPIDTTFFNGMESSREENISSHTYETKEIADDYLKSIETGNGTTHFGFWLFGGLLRKIHNRVMNPSEIVWINGSCIPGSDRLFSDVNGNFFPCERSGSFMNIGNIEDGFIEDTAEDIVSKYTENCQLNCNNCPNIRFCDTCYLAARKGNDVDFSQKYKYCTKKLDKLRLCLYIYASALEKNKNAFYFLEDKH